jgi:selenocysteine lyase/cysteine desulfurase
VALEAAISGLEAIGWDAIGAHEEELARRLVSGLLAIEGVRVLGPYGSGATGEAAIPGPGSLPVVSFTVEGMHHALVAARLSAEFGIAVRHGCFCAHPYVIRLLGLDPAAIDAYRQEVLQGDHRRTPGAVRASAGLGNSAEDIDVLLTALSALAGGLPAPVPYEQDQATGDFFPRTDQPGWRDAARELGAACARG